jgi:hypothetical protein
MLDYIASWRMKKTPAAAGVLHCVRVRSVVRDEDLDSSVTGAAFIRIVGSDGLGFTETFRAHAVSRNPLARQVTEY